MILPNPYPHQRSEQALWHRPKRALFWSPRLGKTLVGVTGLRDVIQRKGIARVLVTAPLVVCPLWEEWLRAAKLHAVPLYKYGSERASKELTAGTAGVVILNDDKAMRMFTALERWAPKAIIIDESHRMKSPSSDRGRALRRLARQASWVRLLTGTPAPNHYGDLWGQMTAIDSRPVSEGGWGPSFSDFANHFLVRDLLYPSRVIAHRNVEQLQALLLRDAGIVRRDDAFGPDNWQEIDRIIDLPDDARRLYDRLAREYVLDAPVEIEATNILSRLTRLQEITSGYLPNDVEGADEPIHDAKFDAIMADLIDIVESDEKAIIFHRFRYEGRELEERIGKMFPDALVGIIHGGIDTDDRDTVVKAFQRRDGAAIAIVQIQSGGVGISFAEATHALFASETFSFAEVEQARDRIYKPGARRVVTRYLVRDSVDVFIRDVQRSKRSIHEAVQNADRRSMTGIRTSVTKRRRIA